MLQGDRGKLYSLTAVYEKPATDAGDSVSMQRACCGQESAGGRSETVLNAGRTGQFRSNSCRMSL